MRQIKFRVWDKENECWFEPTYEAYKGNLEDLLIGLGGDLNIRTLKGLAHQSMFPDRFVLMQFTGLKDKNGVEIYEGDICNQLLLRKFGEEENPRYVGEVTFQPSSGYRVGSEGIWPNDIEVIGNIYENKELLNEKD